MIGEMRIDEKAKIWCTQCQPKYQLKPNETFLKHLEDQHPVRYQRFVQEDLHRRIR